MRRLWIIGLLCALLAFGKYVLLKGRETHRVMQFDAFELDKASVNVCSNAALPLSAMYALVLYFCFLITLHV